MDALLTHLALIRTGAGGADRFGQPTANLVDKASAVPCRLSSPGRGDRSSERLSLGSREVVQTSHVVYFAAGVSITEADTIAEVRDSAGSLLVEDLNVVLVRRPTGGDGMVHHLEALCQRRS